MLRRFLGYLRPDKQILLVPHREGMLIFEGRPRQRLDPVLARIIELFASRPGELVTHDEIADCGQPPRGVEDRRQWAVRRVHEVRQVLPAGFIASEREGHGVIGYRLVQEIKIEHFRPAAGAAGG